MSSDRTHLIKVRRLVLGFLVSGALTVAAFGLVFSGWPRALSLALLAALGVAQASVQLHLFLDVGASRLRAVALALAVLIIIVMVSGTLWVMNDLDARMM
jgi:cytochrome o ubiquinol oxidase operon protein cyoD